MKHKAQVYEITSPSNTVAKLYVETHVLELVFHWVSKPIHLITMALSGWLMTSCIINEFEN